MDLISARIHSSGIMTGNLGEDILEFCLHTHYYTYRNYTGDCSFVLLNSSPFPINPGMLTTS